MKLITTQSVSTMNRNQLSALFAEVSRKVNRTEPQTTERAIGLASLENITRAMQQRLG
jgi:hypothetical protein